MRLRWFALRIYGLTMFFFGLLCTLCITVAMAIFFIPIQLYYKLAGTGNRTYPTTLQPAADKVLVVV